MTELSQAMKKDKPTVNRNTIPSWIKLNEKLTKCRTSFETVVEWNIPSFDMLLKKEANEIHDEINKKRKLTLNQLLPLWMYY